MSTGIETTPVVQTLLKTSAFLLELQDGPEYKPVLADRLGVSKSTVYNWARELLTHEIIEKTAAGYRLTATGRAQIALFTRWQDASRRVHLLESLFTSIPDDHRPPEQLFWNARVLSGTGKITTALSEWLCETTSLRGLAPKTVVKSVRTGQVENGRTVQIESGGAVYDAFGLNPNVVADCIIKSWLFEYSDEVRQDIEDIAPPTEMGLGVSLLEVEEPFSFTLLMRDGPDPALAILLYSDDECAETLVVTDTDSAFQWGQRVYDHYKT